MLPEQKTKIPLSNRIAAWYLIISAVSGVLIAVFVPGPHYAEFEAKSFAFKVGSYLRGYTFHIGCFVAGIGILERFAWAKKLAIILLAAYVIYGSTDFAWGFAHGKPSFGVRVFSFAVLAAWQGFWIYLLCRKPPIPVIHDA